MVFIKAFIGFQASHNLSESSLHRRKSEGISHWNISCYKSIVDYQKIDSLTSREMLSIWPPQELHPVSKSHETDAYYSPSASYNHVLYNTQSLIAVQTAARSQVTMARTRKKGRCSSICNSPVSLYLTLRFPVTAQQVDAEMKKTELQPKSLHIPFLASALSFRHESWLRSRTSLHDWNTAVLHKIVAV